MLVSCLQAPPAKHTSIPALCPLHCPSLAQAPASLARTATVAPTTATACALSPCHPSFLWQREGSCEDQGGPIPSLSATAVAKSSPLTSAPPPVFAPHCTRSPWPCCSSITSGPLCLPQASLPPLLQLSAPVSLPGHLTQALLGAVYPSLDAASLRYSNASAHAIPPVVSFAHSPCLLPVPAPQNVSATRAGFCFLSCVPSA